MGRQIRNPPPYYKQYGSGRTKHQTKRKTRRVKRNTQRGGNIFNALASEKLGTILNQAKNITPYVLDQLINAQRSYAGSRRKKQTGGFGPMAAMMGAQFALPLLGQLINKI